MSNQVLLGSPEQERNCNIIFVYGTLMKGFRRRAVLDRMFKGEIKTIQKMHMRQVKLYKAQDKDYPYIVYTGNRLDTVKGELICVSNRAKNEIQRIESDYTERLGNYYSDGPIQLPSQTAFSYYELPLEKHNKQLNPESIKLHFRNYCERNSHLKSKLLCSK